MGKRERERGGSVWEKGEMGEERGREVCEREGGMGGVRREGKEAEGCENAWKSRRSSVISSCM